MELAGTTRIFVRSMAMTCVHAALGAVEADCGAPPLARSSNQEPRERGLVTIRPHRLLGLLLPWNKMLVLLPGSQRRPQPATAQRSRLP